jgi:hypothetical protein
MYTCSHRCLINLICIYEYHERNPLPPPKCCISFNANLELEFFCDFEVQKVNYLKCLIVRFDVIQKKICVEIVIQFGLLNKIYLIIWIDFVKMNCIGEKSIQHKKLNYQKSSLICTTLYINVKKAWAIQINGAIDGTVILVLSKSQNFVPV